MVDYGVADRPDRIAAGPAVSAALGQPVTVMVAVAGAAPPAVSVQVVGVSGLYSLE